MLYKWFQRNGFSVTLANGMLSAKEKLSGAVSYDMVLSDLRLPDGDGIMLLSWIKERYPSTPVIMMTGYGEIQTAVSAIKIGAFDFLEKPINPSVLADKIKAAFESTNNPKETDSLPREKIESNHQPRENNQVNEKVVGQSTLSKQMYSYINLVAPTQMSVMVTGESGTGKEHVAQMIHKLSSRADAPFVAVDCGSLSTELAPSELFGHKKGSFTSAIEDKTGFFRDANGGTLFLDEVGNLPYGVQMQMLRSLQEKRVRSIGTSNDIEVDVRILAATNENLEQAIAKGTFREDLYHRLNEFMIRVPPLRECVEDIPLYIYHFIDEANSELDKNIEFISPDALGVLESYSWPGNLRELRNVIRRSILFARGDTITVENLPLLIEHRAVDYQERDHLPRDLLSRNYQDSDQQSTGEQFTNQVEDEKKRIIRALEIVNGNKTKAAKLLRIDRKTLYNKLHRYNIGL